MSWHNCARSNQYQISNVSKQGSSISLSQLLMFSTECSLGLYPVGATTSNRSLGHWASNFPSKLLIKSCWFQKKQDSTLKHFVIPSSSWNTCYQINQLFKILYWSIFNTCYGQNTKKSCLPTWISDQMSYMVLFLFLEEINTQLHPTFFCFKLWILWLIKICANKTIVWMLMHK